MSDKQQGVCKPWLCTTFVIYMEWYPASLPGSLSYTTKGRINYVDHPVRTLVASEKTLNQADFYKDGGRDGNDWLTQLKIPGGNVLHTFLDPGTQMIELKLHLLFPFLSSMFPCVGFILFHSYVTMPPKFPPHSLIHTRRKKRNHLYSVIPIKIVVLNPSSMTWITCLFLNQ